MKKKIFRCLSVVMTGLMALSMTACGGKSTGDSGEPIDKSKKQLYVYSYNGGYGTNWLDEAKAGYEAEHSDVQIVIKRDKPLGNNVTKSFISTSKHQVFFHEGQLYYSLNANNAIGDMTDIITSVNPYDNKKIIDKFYDEQKTYYNINDKYYGIPHYAGYFGLIYNIDMFKKNGWYIAEGYDTTVAEKLDDMFCDFDEPRSKGPDGLPGTDDDGLPATYEQFYALCKQIRTTKNGIMPITWTGESRDQYVGYTYQSLVADFEGKEQFSLNFGFDGEATNLGRITDGEFVKDSAPTTIDSTNGYELARQEGRYRALQFLANYMGSLTNHDKTIATNGNDSNVDAMSRLIDGEAAMLMDGAWWENEAVDGKCYGNKTKYDYNMGWMPLPKATAAEVGKKSTLVDHLFSLCFIRPNMSTEDYALAKDFIQYVYSDEMMVKFTQSTGTLKALKYDGIADFSLDGLTTYSQSLINHALKSDVVYPYSTNSIFYNNQADFDGRVMFGSDYKGTTYKNPVSVFVDSWVDEGQKPDVNAYFNGMYTAFQTKWNAFK